MWSASPAALREGTRSGTRATSLCASSSSRQTPIPTWPSTTAARSASGSAVVAGFSGWRMLSNTAGLGSGHLPCAQPSASASASLPDVSPKLVHRHRLTRATATLATHHESELGRQLARRRVVTLLNVGRDAFSVSSIPEVANRGVHRLAADPLIAPFLGDPPTRFDLVRGDPLDAIPGKAQLCTAEETLVS